MSRSRTERLAALGWRWSRPFIVLRPISPLLFFSSFFFLKDPPYFFRLQEYTMFHCQKKSSYTMRLFGLSRLDLSQLTSIYFLSQNTIHSITPTLFIRSASACLVLPRCTLQPRMRRGPCFLCWDELGPRHGLGRNTGELS